MSKLITPTVGRVVWYHPSQHEIDAGAFAIAGQSQPFAAHVAYVHGDRLVNLLVIDHAGASHRRTSVKLLQEDDERPHTSEGPFAEWMPYQLGQAAKAAAESPQSDPEKTVETKVYTDGTSATGTAPLPDLSPTQQDAEAEVQPLEAPVVSQELAAVVEDAQKLADEASGIPATEAKPEEPAAA